MALIRPLQQVQRGGGCAVPARQGGILVNIAVVRGNIHLLADQVLRDGLRQGQPLHSGGVVGAHHFIDGPLADNHFFI